NVDVLTVQDGRVAVLHEPRSWEEKQARFEAEKRKTEAPQPPTAGNKGGRWFGSNDQEPTTATAAPRAVATATAMASAAVAVTPPAPAPGQAGPRGGDDGDDRNADRRTNREGEAAGALARA